MSPPSGLCKQIFILYFDEWNQSLITGCRMLKHIQTMLWKQMKVCRMCQSSMVWSFNGNLCKESSRWIHSRCRYSHAADPLWPVCYSIRVTPSLASYNELLILDFRWLLEQYITYALRKASFDSCWVVSLGWALKRFTSALQHFWHHVHIFKHTSFLLIG